MLSALYVEVEKTSQNISHLSPTQHLGPPYRQACTTERRVAFGLNSPVPVKPQQGNSQFSNSQLISFTVFFQKKNLEITSRKKNSSSMKAKSN